MEDLVVEIESGLIEGILSEDKKYAIFKGIPYAEPPIGKLRFKRSIPKKKWRGVRPVKTFGPKPHQGDPTKIDFYSKEYSYESEITPMSEDCLYLNIWTPINSLNKTKKSNLPVIMWIHGGSFNHGHGNEIKLDGESFTSKNVILVTINYRLGALGYFAHDELEEETKEKISGNYGLWDQINALKWIHNNIENFGGNKNNITIAGQSAGCMSIQNIISSELTKGLISAAIMESGGGIPGLDIDYDLKKQKEMSLELMTILNAKNIKDMRDLSAENIVNAQQIIEKKYGIVFIPNIDGFIIKKNILELAKEGNIHDIPYMIGSTKNDLGDDGEIFRQSAINWGKNQQNLGRKGAFIYHFTRDLPGDDSGAFHSSELWYVFKTLKRCWRPFTKEDYKLGEIINSYWCNFAKVHNPNGIGLPIWLPYNDIDCSRMKLDLVSKMEEVK